MDVFLEFLLYFSIAGSCLAVVGVINEIIEYMGGENERQI